VARRRHLEVTIVIAAQCGLAAALSWMAAHRLFGVAMPVFAPTAAVGTIVAALGQRARRTAELLVGVAGGILVSDASSTTASGRQPARWRGWRGGPTAPAAWGRSARAW
jgi:hypothetical protein